MAAERAGAKTWLYGAIALWALCFWVLGLFGLGARIERLEDDPTMVAGLPQALPAAPQRLGPLPQYAEIGARPLFSENRQPQPFFINPDAENPAAASFDFVLTSVLLTPRFQMAILQPAGGGDSVRLKIGEAPEATPGWVLASIAERSAVFNGPEGQRTLDLRVFDGAGGEPPTAMTVQPAAPPAGPVPQPQPQPRPSAPTRPAPPAPVVVEDAGQPGMPAPRQPAPATGAPAPEAAVQTPDAQIEAIRKRIEARRAQLRREARQPPATPDQTP